MAASTNAAKVKVLSANPELSTHGPEADLRSERPNVCFWGRSADRHGRFRESDHFRRVFAMVLRRCIRERLVGGEGFTVDASLIKADANRQKGIEGNKGLPTEAAGRAIDEYLEPWKDAGFEIENAGGSTLLTSLCICIWLISIGLAWHIGDQIRKVCSVLACVPQGSSVQGCFRKYRSREPQTNTQRFRGASRECNGICRYRS